MRRRSFFKAIALAPLAAIIKPQGGTARDRALADEWRGFVAKQDALAAEADARLARMRLPAWPGVPAFTEAYTTDNINAWEVKSIGTYGMTLTADKLDALSYADSDGNTPEALAALHDGNSSSGGVEYQP